MSKRRPPDNVVQFIPPIRQEELLEEELLIEEVELALVEWAKKRVAIQDRLDAGARIEPGERMGMTNGGSFDSFLERIGLQRIGIK